MQYKGHELKPILWMNTKIGREYYEANDVDAVIARLIAEINELKKNNAVDKMVLEA